MRQEKISAILLAGGSGKRMQSDIPKQYMVLGDKPVLSYSLAAFDESSVDEIILVVNESDMEYLKDNILKQYPVKKPVHLVPGGEERYLSVYNGLKSITDTDFVLIHDGARPFITVEMIERVIISLREYPACAVGVPVKDTIKIVDTTGTIIETPDRSMVWAIQTPQAFSVPLIVRAYEMLLSHLQKEEHDKKVPVTDDTMVIEYTLKYPVKMIMGSYSNIKITTPEDMIMGEALLYSGN
ncbi:2-C-methyl-D-erythritol 4-phosphate cytidylyltransferase [Anaerocolumna xylanovorans]|uniref:2-C-methyl-D-erythritol 4-phosphate cytidylyltransferase n=1 Tax=Anaerocolumna xylanovorans DSM 12503 TaxID=1121345 RepID=A0A1M7YAI5_9FIRM|nr:2-C-methyl-D-erythritol 4-phosphate cytidylyltransferase [Anaerocolumna xylanovorans]SHO49601.1 2-C-methyl-D-erythritol 4-phosphate cytidylyltransferase [Anaerocolumna xylanovorans DSM 12503]